MILMSKTYRDVGITVEHDLNGNIESINDPQLLYNVLILFPIFKIYHNCMFSVLDIN